MVKILIVDDEAHIRNILSEFFRRAGFDVQVTGNPDEAMRLCQSECFDVVLSDILMPGTNGHDIARWVSIQCPRTRVVLMSGFDPGCDDCPYFPRCPLVHKPFVPQDVVRVVTALLETPPPEELGRKPE